MRSCPHRPHTRQGIRIASILRYAAWAYTSTIDHMRVHAACAYIPRHFVPDNLRILGTVLWHRWSIRRISRRGNDMHVRESLRVCLICVCVSHIHFRRSSTDVEAFALPRSAKYPAGKEIARHQTAKDRILCCKDTRPQLHLPSEQVTLALVLIVPCLRTERQIICSPGCKQPK